MYHWLFKVKRNTDDVTNDGFRIKFYSVNSIGFLLFRWLFKAPLPIQCHFEGNEKSATSSCGEVEDFSRWSK